MAFGKKNIISDDLSKYSLILLGQPGIGKSTCISQACAKEFGEDGYLLLNMGKEDGVSAIDGVIYEDVEDWKKFDTVVKDIVKNKKTDYPNLRVVVLDTLDQTLAIAEPKCIERYNAENMGRKDFTPAKGLNSCWGGFGAGMDYVINMILDKIWQLKKAGVQVWMTGHVKQKEILDALTNQTYTTLSTDMAQKYFNAFKSKVHVVGVACIDRTIETEGTGRKNIVTHREVTVNRIKGERRKIVFRDDNYSVDSKSRFAGIVDEIPLDADELLKALHDAIRNSKSSTSIKSLESESKNEEPVKTKSNILPKEPDVEADDMLEDALEETQEDSKYPEDLLGAVKTAIKTLPKDKKVIVAQKVKEFGKLTDVPEEVLKEIFDIIND